jgi:hypothetical protein
MTMTWYEWGLLFMAAGIVLGAAYAASQDRE